MTSSIPEVSVPMKYMLDPATEDVLFGDDLRPGMIVVLEDGALRTDPDGPRENPQSSKWCQVDSIRFSENRNGKTVCFTGLYADGMKRMRGVYVTSHGWIVKKNSIPSTRG